MAMVSLAFLRDCINMNNCLIYTKVNDNRRCIFVYSRKGTKNMAFVCNTLGAVIASRLLNHDHLARHYGLYVCLIRLSDVLRGYDCDDRK